jgi:hypothetical protein
MYASNNKLFSSDKTIVYIMHGLGYNVENILSLYSWAIIKNSANPTTALALK